MQAKLKYKLFGEFSDTTVPELVDWFSNELKLNISEPKTLKVTIDWEPASEDV